MTSDLFTILPAAAAWALGAGAAAFHLARRRREPTRHAALMRRLLIASVVIFIVLALAATTLQYAAWKGDSLSSKLLPPHQSILYFAKYAGTHFWLAPILSLIVSGAFYGFLRVLKRKNERFFEEGEVELGALAAFLVGWPRVIVFLPAVFLAVVLISGIKMALHKGAYTTLGIPFLIGLAATLACGYVILESLGLEFIAVIPGA
jgi:hypothetical protein